MSLQYSNNNFSGIRKPRKEFSKITARAITAGSIIVEDDIKIQGNAVVDGTTTLNDNLLVNAYTTIENDLNVNAVYKQYGYELLPRFTVLMWSGAVVNIPVGWLLCDGRTVTVNGVSVTAPDLRGRFVLSYGQGPLDFVNTTIGASGGEQKHTLSTSEIPSHSHTQTTINDDFNNTSAGANGGYPNFQYPSYPRHDGSGSVTWTNTINSTGGGDSHNNMPPYYVLCFIMKGF